MENYTKFALKPEEDLRSLLQSADDLFVLACGKCYKEFDTANEPELEQFVALAKELGKRITGTAQGDFLCNKTKALRLPDMIPEGTKCVFVISCGLGIQTVAGPRAMPHRKVSYPSPAAA